MLCNKHPKCSVEAEMGRNSITYSTELRPFYCVIELRIGQGQNGAHHHNQLCPLQLLSTFESLLNALKEPCGMDRVLLFDVATKCYIATDTESVPTNVSKIVCSVMKFYKIINTNININKIVNMIKYYVLTRFIRYVSCFSHRNMRCVATC